MLNLLPFILLRDRSRDVLPRNIGRGWMMGMALFALFASAGAAFAQADTTPLPEIVGPSEEELTISLDDSAEREIEEYVKLLGAPLYADRERATRELTDIGIRTFRRLREEYRRTDDVEVRLRIEGIVRQAYFDHHVYDRNGFLGISQDTRFYPDHNADSRIPEGFVGVRVRQVIEHTAAEAAGISVEDIVISVDGETIPFLGERTAEVFGNSLRVRGPGARVTLGILRGSEELELAVRLGRRPPQYYANDGTAHSEMLSKAQAKFPEWWKTVFVGPDGESR